MTIASSAEVITIRRIAKEMAKEIGFNERVCEEIVLVVSELASNILKYATPGVVTLTPVAEDHRKGLLIEAIDNGPGFNENIAMTDGFSSSGTLGFGLGAVNRMMDEFDIFSNKEGQPGTRIICKRWIYSTAPSTDSRHCPFDFGIVSHAKPGEHVNGDSFVIKQSHHSSLAAVIDGVGHGFLAQQAALTARHYIESHSELPLLDIFRGVDRACRSTRGVVMALAIFDWDAMTLTFASVGNIEVKVLGMDPHNEKFKFIVRRGIVGKNAPTPVITENKWHRGYVLALHSDGLSTQWNWDDFSHHADMPAQFLAEQIHQALKKSHDDSTLIIVK
jgi:anti-sigma regulatory factor (Ser/Thr protein kinase)